MNKSDEGTSYDEGLTAHMRGDFDEAIAIFERVVAEHPTNAAAYHQMGRCFMKLGDFPRAINNLETAVRIGPDRTAARLDLGTLYIAVGETSKAKAQFMRALSRSDANVKAMAALGIVHFLEGEHGKAISQFQDAIELNPANFACHYYLAKVHEALKNPAGMQKEALKSAAICHSLIQVRSEQPEGYYFLAQAYMLQEETRAALQNYLIAKDFSPDDAVHFFAFGLHYTRVDNYLGIARCYEKLGEREYARYFGQMTLRLDAGNEEAKRFALLEG
jgi:tetratricopeptide (TPR) repeat protein